MYNIIKSVDLPDYLVFKSECDCGEHDLHITIEKDDTGYVTLGLSDVVYIETADAADNVWYKNLWRRIKTAWQILFRGWVEVDYEFAFKDQNHVNEFVDFLNDSLKRINEGPGEAEAGPAKDAADEPIYQ